jgi:hypothetical protein
VSAHTGVYAYSNWLGGHSPPPRPLLAVIWVFGFFLIVFFREEKEKWYIRAGGLLCVISFGLALIFLNNPRLLYHTLRGFDQTEKSRLLTQLDTPDLPLTSLLPSTANIDWRQASWSTLAAWGLIAFAVLVIFTAHAGRKRHAIEDQRDKAIWNRRTLVFYCAVFIGGLLFWKWADLVPVDGEVYYEGPREHSIYFRDRDTCWIEGQGFWVKGDKKTRIYLLSSFKINNLQIVMRGRSGNRLIFSAGGKEYARRIDATDKLKFAVEKPAGWKWKGRYLYSLSFESLGGWIPRDVSGGPDTRYLGFFVKMFPS